ncbi:hypothetical protein ACS0TY_024827 [Phlomoides rotata]
MLAISPQFCPSGWLLDDPIIPIIHHQENLNYFSRERTETSESIDLSPNSSRTPHHKNGEFTSNFHDGEGDKTAKTKKLNHNASERDRRRKINTLYADLRSLLPLQDQSRKLSIPTTVSRVLKYIPELQKEVERLIQKKERLISKQISMVEDSSFKFKNQSSCSSSVSATRISDGEIIIQSSMPKSEKASFSEAILRLEDEGFLMMNASCFESFEGRLFFNLHLQAQGGQVKDVEMLKEKVWPFI